MTDDLAEIYDRDFFAPYGAESPSYVRACDFIAGEIHRRFRPRTAVDWGCGAGFHGGSLHRRGVVVRAVDGVVVAEDQRDPDIRIQRADLTRPVPAELTFPHYDLSLCIDVLEHLASAEVALANVTRGAGLLILSCAPPGQGGHHHVHERPRRYWVARLAELGWRYDRGETGAMERTFLAHRDQVPLSWMYHNLCVYRPTHAQR